MNVLSKLALTTFAVLVMTLATASNGFAIIVQTTFTFDPVAEPDGGQIVDRLVVDWEVDQDTGIVGRANLVNWSLSLFGGNQLVFMDTIVVNGVRLPLAGINRTPNSAIRFDANADTLTLNQFDNLFSGSLLTPGDGFLNVFFNSPFSVPGLRLYDGGNAQIPNSQVRLRNVQQSGKVVISEPEMVWLLAGGFFGFLLLVGMQRQRETATVAA